MCTLNQRACNVMLAYSINRSTSPTTAQSTSARVLTRSGGKGPRHELFQSSLVMLHGGAQRRALTVFPLTDVSHPRRGTSPRLPVRTVRRISFTEYSRWASISSFMTLGTTSMHNPWSRGVKSLILHPTANTVVRCPKLRDSTQLTMNTVTKRRFFEELHDLSP